MSKDKKQKKRSQTADVVVASAGAANAAESKAKISNKEFEKEMEKLQVELVKMQEWVKASGAKVCVLFEGRDEDPRKIWKLTPMDLRSYTRWYDYSRARDAMFAATDTPDTPNTSAGIKVIIVGGVAGVAECCHVRTLPPEADQSHLTRSRKVRHGFRSFLSATAFLAPLRRARPSPAPFVMLGGTD